MVIGCTDRFVGLVSNTTAAEMWPWDWVMLALVYGQCESVVLVWTFLKWNSSCLRCSVGHQGQESELNWSLLCPNHWQSMYFQSTPRFTYSKICMFVNSTTKYLFTWLVFVIFWSQNMVLAMYLPPYNNQPLHVK